MFTNLKRKAESLIESFLNFVGEVSLWAFLIVGLAVVGLSVGYALMIPVQPVAVSLATVGSIAGTAIVCMILPKLVAFRVKEERVKLEQAAAERAEIEAKVRQAEERSKTALAEINKLQTQSADLEMQIQRYRAMRLDTNNFKPILRLGVLELDADYKDFTQEKLSEDKGVLLQRAEVHEYVGLIQMRCKANLGVDLKKLRFHDENNVLVVSGLEPEFQGVLHQNEDWLLKEIRVKKSGGALPESYEILSDDPRLTNKTIEQRKAVQERLNAGLDFKFLDGGIRRLAREFLTALLQPIGKRIEFREVETGQGCGLLDYLENHNNGITSEERKLSQKREQLIKSIGAILGSSA